MLEIAKSNSKANNDSIKLVATTLTSSITFIATISNEFKLACNSAYKAISNISNIA